MTLPQAVLFDLDGLLLDTERLILDMSLKMLNDMGFPATRDLFHSFIGRDELESFEILQSTFPDLDGEAYKAKNQQAIHDRYLEGIPLKDGAIDLLTHLKASGMPIAVGTNSRVESGVSKLEHSGLDKYFDVLVGFDAVARPKPHPDIFVEAALRLGTTADNCVIFEDSDTGVTAAHAAGGFVIQVPDMIAPRIDLAHIVAPTLLEGARAKGLFN